MLRQGTLRLRRFGGADVHASIQSHGVHGNDLGVETLSEFDAELGLARSGRAGQHQGVLKRRRKHGWRKIASIFLRQGVTMRPKCHHNELLGAPLGSETTYASSLYRDPGNRSSACGFICVPDQAKKPRAACAAELASGIAHRAVGGWNEKVGAGAFPGRSVRKWRRSIEKT